jgi:glycosyltransferase involved in cell wall biosynthesis
MNTSRGKDMKLIVLLPAFNEEENISKTILEIPRKINGVDKVEVLVVDDGSSDKTVDVALNGGADKVVTHVRNMGVGAAFMTGIRNAILRDADIVVTVDADSQFDSNQIPELILPILNNQADMVTGSRFENGAPKEMPAIKSIGNKIFSRLVSWVTSQKFSDTQCGFRAYSKEALRSISVVNNFTYTQEVLIDLKFKNMRIVEIPIDVKYDEKRKSRVVKNIVDYTWKALSIVIRTLIYHRPILAFSLFGFLIIGGGILAKILTIFNVINITAGLSTGLIILGVVSIMLGMLASVIFKRQAFVERDLREFIRRHDDLE